MALGGSLLKASPPDVHSLTMSAASMWPAARTGRSANTIAFGDRPSSVSFCPWSLALRALTTISEGTILTWAFPIVFCAGVVTAFAAGGLVAWAKTTEGALRRTTSAASREG